MAGNKPKKISAKNVKVAATNAEAWTAKQPIPNSGPYTPIAKNFEMVVFDSGKNAGVPVWNFELHYPGGFKKYESLNIPTPQAKKKGKDVDAYTGLLKQFLRAFGKDPDKMIAKYDNYEKLGAQLEGKPVKCYFVAAEKIAACDTHYLNRDEFEDAKAGKLKYNEPRKSGAGKDTDTPWGADDGDGDGDDDYYGDDDDDDGDPADDDNGGAPTSPQLPGGKKKNKDKKNKKNKNK